MLPIFINILLVIHVLVSLFIILLVLMQRPKNEGLGAAFGGGMMENIAGAGATNLLQSITRWCGIIFFALSLTLSWLYVKNVDQGKRNSMQENLLKTAPPAAVPGAPGVMPPVNPANVDEVQKALQKALENIKADESGTATPPIKLDMATPAPGVVPDAGAPTPGTEPKPSEPAPAGATPAPAPATPAAPATTPAPATPAPR
jgi:preprotein translocase subunit SecG